MAPKRPGTGAIYVRPIDEDLVQILGAGWKSGGVTITRDQMKALRRYYGFDPDYPNRTVEEGRKAHEAKMEEWRKEMAEASTSYERRKIENRRPKPYDEGALIEFYQGGSGTNLLRQAEVDGKRAMAFLARYLRPDEDVVHFLEGLLIEMGYDVPYGGWEEEEYE